MLLNRLHVQRTLKLLSRLDAGGSPFIGLQWGDQAALFHRSGSTGIIESVGYDRHRPAMVVSLPHLSTMIGNASTDEINMSADAGGTLCLDGVSESGNDHQKVYTIRPNIAWAKTHDVGKITTELAPDGFRGINTQAFTLTYPPVLRRGKLMLATDHGVVMRNDLLVDAYPYPRDGFLRMLPGLAIDRMYLTEGGYWGARAGDIQFQLAGHRFGDNVFDQYAVGAAPMGEMAADRVLSLLRKASDLTDTGQTILMDPSIGVQVRDQHNYVNRYSFLNSGGWEPFRIKGPTARLLHDALVQDREETLVLERMAPPILRLRRGPFEVSFKTFPGDSTRPA